MEVTHDDLEQFKNTEVAKDLGRGDEKKDGLIVYTSGTTGKPKGVVHTHSSLMAQMDSLSKAWQWSESDRILNVLPLHHVHGVINVLNCSLWNGAECEMTAGKFDSHKVWLKLLREDQRFSVFMAVPTVYNNLVSHLDAGKLDTTFSREEIKYRLLQYRLMVSGSAALPIPLPHRWEEISGHRLLERFGMTETLMAVSNPYLDPT